LFFQEKERLHELERKLGYKDIRFYRSMARSELRKERATIKQSEEQQQLQQNKTGDGSSGQGWFGWLWGGSTQTQETNDQPQDLLNEEQRKELYAAIDWDEKQVVAASMDLPKDVIKLRVTGKLDKGSFALRRDPHGRKDDIISLVFNSFQAGFIQRPEDNFEASVSLGGVSVYDKTGPETVHPQVVRVKADRITAEETSDTDDDREINPRPEGDPDAADNPFFFLKFENRPLDERADMALSVKMRYMEIVYHRGYVEEVFRFFKPPESQLESVEALMDVASETLEGIRKETRAGLEYALENHRTVDLRVDMNAYVLCSFALSLVQYISECLQADPYFPRGHLAPELPSHYPRCWAHRCRKRAS
jgi:vacuolar protein sorting-associated protein 13A/C